jgi:hypothetical protein
MTPLSKRKTRLSFITADEVREQGRYRQVIIEAHPGYAVIRLHGLRRAFTLTYGAMYQFSVRQAVEQARREKAAKKQRGAR